MKTFKFKTIEDKQIETLESVNAELLFKSAENKIKIEVLENENANILIKLAMLEVGKNV